MSTSTTCDICGEDVDRSERIVLSVDDPRTSGLARSRPDMDMTELRALVDETTRRSEEAFRFSRSYDMHIACFREHIEPALRTAFRLEKREGDR